ncbi:MAG: T9SS type A sorting domain-containing protein [Chitinophagales bacterium]|nr:T9SS type A sorting domain-containing protein [Chitinophagales bacterium]
MRKFYTAFFCFLFIAFIAAAQYPEPKINPNDPNIPAWVKLMYDESKSVYTVDSAYEAYYSQHPFLETTYTRWYMRWRRYVSPFLDENGFVHFPTQQDMAEQLQLRNQASASTRDEWTFAGPDIHYSHKSSENDLFEPISEHANIYCVDRSVSNPSVLFAGSESGGVYKSTDAGESWSMVTHDMLVFDVKCVKIHPENENVVLFGAAGEIYKSVDGGITWNVTGDAAFQSLNIYLWDMQFNPANPSIVYAATNYGLYRSTDAGDNWTQVFSNQSMSVQLKPDDASVVYALRYDPAQQIPYLWKSLDSGATFIQKPDGWFEVPPQDFGKIESDGGRIAVTNADPERVYVLLVGNSQSNATLQLGGYIGVYVSNDAGESWSLPQGYLGAPYNVNTAPCLMDFDGHSADYNQIYYNTYIAASHLNADRILIGGLNMWRSDDGAATYQGVGGYIGGLPLMHVDIQSIKVYQTSDTTEEVWWSSDGGVNHSADFLQTHESKCRGIYATELWGFDQGWNDDIMVGGRYHNGNMGRFENYPQGEFIALGGGEAPTGYANYSDERITQFSDIGTVKLPEEIDGITKYLGAAGQPNESYYFGESSRVIYDWNNYHTAYMGKDNKLYKSDDGGMSFYEFHSFANSSNKIIWIEQSRANTDVMYVQQFQGTKSVIWKTTDGGITWATLTLPITTQKYLVFSLSATNADELWLGYVNTGNGSKVYHTTDGGTTWTNLTTSSLDDLNVWAIAHQYGTDGGVYIAVKQGVVFYRNNQMSDWEVIGDGLPAVSQPLRLVPFYKGNKIRFATYHVGVWEHDFYEPSSLLADFGVGNQTIYCAGDTIFFSDHSVATANAAYQWSFPDAIPSSSSEKNPQVIFNEPGNYEVTLIVTDGGLSDTIMKTVSINGVLVQAPPIAEGFESGQFDPNWLLTQWSISESVGGYGASSHAMYFDNYDVDLGGQYADVHTSKFDLMNLPDATLKFDVAYAAYGGPYIDTMEVLASTDCGATFTLLYKKGGADLTTADYDQSYFIPSASQWRTDSVSLDGFVGNPEVVIAFRDVGYYGNVLYVDNVNLSSSLFSAVAEPDHGMGVAVFPNPGDGHFTLSVSASSSQKIQVEIQNAIGAVIQSFTLASTNDHEHLIDLTSYGTGIYWMKIQSGDQQAVKKLIVQ